MGFYSIYPAKPVDSLAARVLGIPKKSKRKKKRPSKNRKRNCSKVILSPVTAKTTPSLPKASSQSKTIIRCGGDPKRERIVHQMNENVSNLIFPSK